MNETNEAPASAPRRLRIATDKLRGRYVVTALLALTCIVLFFFRYLWSDGGTSEHLLRMGANYGPRVKGGEVYRLLASAFLHGDGLHLFANMLALWSFGPVLEALFGPRRYLVLYGASALVGSAASAFLTDPRMSVGASGAVWGLMTAGIAIVYRPQGLLPEGVLASARQRAWAPLAINLMYSFKPGVDFLAHIGGGVVGAALVLSGAITGGLRPLDAGPFSRRGGRGESVVWTALAAITALAMVGSLAMGFAQGKPWEAGKPPVLKEVAIGDTGIAMGLPDVVTSHLKVEPHDATTSYEFGEADDAPLLFQVVVGPLDGPIPPENLEGELAGLKKIAEENIPEESTRVSPARIETIGAHTLVLDEVKLKTGVVVKRYWMLVGVRFVMLRSYEIGDRPKSWADVETQIVKSVRGSAP